MRNPFMLGVATGEFFCDRADEKNRLLQHAHNGQNIVLSAKRRMGKSSLVSQVLKELEKEDVLTVYASFFKISSEQEFITTLATAIIRSIGREAVDNRTVKEKITGLFNRIIVGMEIKQDKINFTARIGEADKFEYLLEDLMQGLYAYMERYKVRAVCVFDEFQEVLALSGAKRIEGTIREYMQFRQDICYIFVGSKRRMLLEMFTQKSRPFYKSAYAYSLAEIAKGDFVPYLVNMFEKSGKSCAIETAGMIYDLVEGYTYYVQKLSSLAWDISDIIDVKQVREAYDILVRMEGMSDFVGIWNGLPLGQKAVLKAIAKGPGVAIYSKGFLSAYNLSQGTVQRAINPLIINDYVEQANGGYKLTDPVLAEWLKNQDYYR